MSVKRTMVAVRVYVWIHSSPLSVTVMLDIHCTVMATAVKVFFSNSDSLHEIDLFFLSHLSLDIDECAEHQERLDQLYIYWLNVESVQSVHHPKVTRVKDRTSLHVCIKFY